MKINRDQYEVWFLDYLEGNLDESLLADFRSFLLENPDLAEELEQYEPLGLTKPEIKFPGRKRLYKQSFDIPEVFDSTAVGLMEGDLDPDRRITFESYLADHPEKSLEMALFRQTKLHAETSSVFKNKRRLYRSTRHAGNTFSILFRIAAIILLALILPVVTERIRPVGYPFKEPSDMISENHSITEIFPSGNGVKEMAAVLGEPITKNRPVAKPIEISSAISENGESAGDPTLLAFSGRNELPSLLPEEKEEIPYLLKTEEPALMEMSPVFDYLALNNSGEMYLSEKLVKKMGLSELKLGKVVRWGLTLASGLSKGKFNYSTSESGDIIALNLDTRLLGFNIPVNEK